MRRTTLSLLPMLALFAACGSAEVKSIDAGGPVRPEAPERTVFIRASFDDDPSDLLGRFFPDSLDPQDLDENAAKVGSRCRKFLTTKKTKASGEFEQTFNASRGVKASLGIKPFGAVSGGQSGETGLLVKYAMTEKMTVTAADQDGLAQCCAAAPAECGRLMIGEFWRGTGTVFQFAGKETGVEATASKGKVDAEVSYKDGWKWKRVSSFTDAYFAFRTAAGPEKGRLCEDDWASAPPQSLDGQFFVGTAAVLAPEPKAREEAMRNARRAVVKYLGETLTETYSGESSTIGGAIADETLVTAAANGVAERVKDRCWSAPSVRSTPEGPFTEIKVLAFFPNAELKPAQVEVVEVMAAKATVQKKPQVASKLKALAAKLRE